MATYEKVCEYCGKPFIAHMKNHAFCSKKCRDISLRLRKGIKCNPNLEPFHKICPVCGKDFDTFREAAVTCSSECAQLYRSKARYGNTGTQRDPRMCVICGAIFIPRTDTQETCSRVCFLKKYNEARNKKRAAMRPPAEYEARICPTCGEEFQADKRGTRKYCCQKCSKAAERERRGRKDDRIPKAARVDKIDIHRLFRRDNGKCYICGCNCDWNDWRTAKSGNQYPGDSYPTIDHVLPVSKGGLDAWANVRLACWKCNIGKSDTVIDAGDLDIVFAYSQKPKGNPPKKTAQYTLTGELVKVWDSTAQIRRELGLNDKRIQTVCKRRRSNTGNAFGYHWEYVNG